MHRSIGPKQFMKQIRTLAEDERLYVTGIHEILSKYNNFQLNRIASHSFNRIGFYIKKQLFTNGYFFLPQKMGAFFIIENKHGNPSMVWNRYDALPRGHYADELRFFFNNTIYHDFTDDRCAFAAVSLDRHSLISETKYTKPQGETKLNK